MTITEDIEATLKDGRALALSRMDSRARFYVEGARGALNPTSRTQAATAVDVATNVPCRFAASRGVEARGSTPGDGLGAHMAREVSIPWDSPAIPAGAFMELTEIGEWTDPTLVGIRWRVVDPGQASQQTARRMTVEVDK